MHRQCWWDNRLFFSSPGCTYNNLFVLECMCNWTFWICNNDVQLVFFFFFLFFFKHICRCFYSTCQWPTYLGFNKLLKLSGVKPSDYGTLFTSYSYQKTFFYRATWKISSSPEATSSTLSWRTDSCTQVSNALCWNISYFKWHIYEDAKQIPAWTFWFYPITPGSE